MTRRVVLVRHAESSNNDLYRRTGTRAGRAPDPLLSPYGEQQARRVADALAADRSLHDVPVWASPTARAAQTAGAIVRAGTGSHLELHPDLAEGGGIYETDADDRHVAVDGRPLDELRALAGTDLRWGLDEHATWGGGLEEHDAVPTRVARLLGTVRACEHDTLVLVAHGWLAQFVVRDALGLPTGLDDVRRGWLRVPNASITEILLGADGTADLVRLGVDAHLDDVPDREPSRHASPLLPNNV